MERIHSELPRDSGVGLKPTHYREILDHKPKIGWFEVHPENYMGAGGPPHAYLTAIREHYPISLHGVGLSIGGSGPLDRDHLDRLKQLVVRYEPGMVSEHLAWSTHQGRSFNDLLALPYTAQTLASVCDHIDQVQTHLGRSILLENPATYIRFTSSTYDEIDFISAIVSRTGCGLLLDVNNVYVSCTNHDLSPDAYLARFPVEPVGEIHLAGHAEDRDSAGHRLLIDAHDREVSDPVWILYEKFLHRAGPIPTLIEWDNNIPDWPILRAEAQRTGSILQRISATQSARHVA